MNFEFKDPKSGDILYLEVLETFEHYYTKKKIYRCRVHNRSGYSSEWSFDQEEFEEVLENRIRTPIGYVIFKDGTKEEIIDIGIIPDVMLIFSTKKNRYRFNVYLRNEVVPRPEWVFSRPKHVPTFEYFNPNNGYWYRAFNIDHIEIHEEYMKNER